MRCSACSGPFRKRDLFGKNGKEYFHIGNQPGGFYAGYVDDDGAMIHQFPDNKSMASALMSGKGRFTRVDLSKFPPRVVEL